MYTPLGDYVAVWIRPIRRGRSSTRICQQVCSTNHQSSQSAAVEEELVCVGFMTVLREPVIDDVGESVKTGEFGERQELGVVKALHEESATWLTGSSVDEQRQSKQQNPRQCHVVSGDYRCNRKHPLSTLQSM